jgi:hypothetical protein
VQFLFKQDKKGVCCVEQTKIKRKNVSQVKKNTAKQDKNVCCVGQIKIKCKNICQVESTCK